MKKWIVRLSLSLATLFLLLLLLPLLFKGKIVEAVTKSANQNLQADLSFDPNLRLSFLRQFPNLTVGVQDLNIVGQDSFDGVELLHADELQLTINLKFLFSDHYEIGSIQTEGLRTHIVYLESGRANYDITMSDTGAVDTTTVTPLSLSLERIALNNTTLVYDDATIDYHMALKGLDLLASGAMEDVQFDLETELSCKSLDMSYAGMTLLQSVAMQTETVLNMDMDKFRFGFDVKEILLNELPLTAKGWVQLNEDNIDMDIAAEAKGSDFKAYLSAVPGAYTDDFSGVKTSGKAAFSLALKGQMTDDLMPATDLKLLVENASVQYPGLPGAVNGIQVDFHFENADGIVDHSIVDLKQLALNLNGSPFGMQLYMSHPESNPYAKGKMDVETDLSKWSQFLPTEAKDLKGWLAIHASFDGHYSELNSGAVADLKAEGSLEAKGIQTQYSGLAFALTELKASLNPKQFDLSSLDMTWGKSRLQGSAQVTNALGYVLNDETLHGRLNMVSQSIDANEWMAALSSPTEPVAAVSEAQAEDGALAGRVEPDTASALPVLPKNLDLVAKATIDKLIYDSYELENCQADIRLQDGIMTINPLSAEWMGSQFSLNNTRYAYALGGKPEAALGLNILKINPSALAEHLSLIQSYAPILKNIDGLANLGFNLSSNLTPAMQPDFSSTDANGVFELFKGMLNVPKWMATATEPLKLNSSAWQLSPTKVGFEIVQGKLAMKDSLKLTMPEGALMSVKGAVGLDNSVAFGGTIRYKGKTLPFSIGGTTADPVMKVDFKALGIQMAQPYVDQAKEKKDQAVNEALNAARKEADRIKAEASKQADRIRSEAAALADKQRSLADKAYETTMNEAQKQADLLVAQAGNPLAKAAAQKAGEKAVKEADKKATAAREKAHEAAAKLEADANEKANALEIEASLKADAVIKAAEEKAG